MAQESNWAPLAASPLWRFTLKQLFVWTAFIALGCVALRSASPTWVSTMLGVTLLALGASLLLTLFRDGRQRAYWLGFATLGWLYVFVLAYAWSLDPNSGTFWGNPLRPEELATVKLTNKIYAWMYPPVVVTQPAYAGMGGPGGGMGGYGGGGSMPMGMGGMSMAGSSDGGMSGSAGPGMPGVAGMPAGVPGMMGGGSVTLTLPAPGPSQQDFTNVAHSLWTLILAACGGWLATWLHATRSKSNRGTADHAD